MSYPEPLYLAEAGAVSAQVRPAAQGPDLALPRASVHYLATGATTGGLLGCYRWDMTADPSGPSAHFHRTISESFFVLSGTVQLYDGARWVSGTPGDFLHVPPGGLHAFRNESGAPASMLLLFCPGAPRERYFEALAELAESGRTMSDEERVEFLRSHDQYEP